MLLAFVLINFALSANLRADSVLNIVGTGDGIAVLDSIGDAFHNIHPETRVIVLPSIGSSGGIKAVSKDKYQLGRIAREIKETEQSYNLSYKPFARVSVVFLSTSPSASRTWMQISYTPYIAARSKIGRTSEVTRVKFGLFAANKAIVR